MIRYPQRCDGPGLRRPPGDGDDQVRAYYSHQHIIQTLSTHLPGEFISVDAEGGPKVDDQKLDNNNHRKMHQ